MGTLDERIEPIERINGAVRYLNTFYNGAECNPQVTIQTLEENEYARVNYDHESGESEIIIDLDKYSKETSSGEFLYQSIIFDLIVGEEVGHILYFSLHNKDWKKILPEHKRAMSFIMEVLGHYSGLVYANRRNKINRVIGIGADASEELHNKAYKSADKIFLKHRESKLKKLANIKGVVNTLREIEVCLLVQPELNAPLGAKLH